MFAQDYARFYELFNQDKPYKKEIDLVYKLAKKPRSILDIGCGTAHYWSYFYKHQVFMIGIERSKEMIRLSNYETRIDWLEATRIKDFKRKLEFDAATMLFDVINYIPDHKWWKDIPLKKGGFLIFDIWDKEKIDKDGFEKTGKEVNGIMRTITPLNYNGNSVILEIDVNDDGMIFQEHHQMHLHSHKDIERFCDNEFEIVETKSTKNWQKWYKLKKK